MMMMMDLLLRQICSPNPLQLFLYLSLSPFLSPLLPRNLISLVEEVVEEEEEEDEEDEEDATKEGERDASSWKKKKEEEEEEEMHFGNRI